MLELVPVNDLDISELGLALIRWCQANDYDAPHTFSKGGSFTPEMAVEWLVWQTKEEPYPTWTLLREELGFGPGGAKLIHAWTLILNDSKASSNAGRRRTAYKQ